MENPIHPGIFINETYIKPLKLNIAFVADKLGVSYSSFYRLIKGKSSVSAEMALRLNKCFGLSPESFLIMQRMYDLSVAKRKINLDNVKVLYKVES